MRKRMLSFLLAATLLSAAVMEPVAASVSLYQTKAVTAAAGSGTLSESSDRDTLEKLNFDLPDEKDYNRNELKTGKQAIQVMSEVSVEKYERGRQMAYIYNNDTGKGVQTLADTSLQYTSGDLYSDYYSVSTSIDMYGHGGKEFIARIHFENGESGGRILLSIINPKFNNGEPNLKVFDTGGYIKTGSKIPSWELKGLLNLCAGDFDGDGSEELAVYTPNNSDEVETGQDTPNKLEVKIYNLDLPDFGKELTPELEKTIDITDGATEWAHSYYGSVKQYFSIPYLSMTAEDLNDDGIDDLMTVANFGRQFRGLSPSVTWEQILDPDTCFASVLDVYQGTSGDAELKQTVRKKALVSTNDPQGSCGYAVRNASAIVGNVTGANSREIIIGGNYTRLSYNSETNTDSVVANTRDITLNNSEACTIAGYTSYANMLSDDTLASTIGYTWTAFNNGYSKLQYYADYGSYNHADEPVALAAFAAYGYEYKDTLFIEGQLIEYSDETGGLADIGYSPASASTFGKTCRWIGSVAVGNVTNSPYGQETVYYTFMAKKKKKELYYANVVSIWGTTSAGRKGYESSVKNDIYNGVDKQHVEINMVDIDTDTGYITYSGDNTEVYYSDVEVMSVMQAAPVWKELGNDYTGDAETTFSKSTGSSTGQTVGGTVTAGVVAGFEQETSFLGLFKCAGMSFETKLTFSLGYEYGHTASKEFTTSYNAKGTNDVALIYTVPYVRYKCRLFIPQHTVTTEEEYISKKEFVQELEKNLLKYRQYKTTVSGGKYSHPSDGYNDWYSTDVSKLNYNSQLKVYQDYLKWIEDTEASIKELGRGGTYSWGQKINYGIEKTYYYSIPQTPIVTTIDVSKYDEIAKSCKDLTPIYGNVFGEGYRAGDPGTYAGTVSELNVASGTEVLTGKTNTGSSADTGGFITSSALSSESSTPSQTISVTSETSNTISYGTALETTLTANAGGVNAGVTSSVEANGSHTWVRTEGNEYSGQVPNLPKGTDNAYSYGWKLVAYTAELNNKQVPVVGYLTKLNRDKRPPSVPIDATATELNDRSVVLQWTKGDRPADSYNVYRVLTSGNRVEYDLLGTTSEDDFGIYSFVDDAVADGGLDPETEYSYVISAVKDNVSSVKSEEIKVKTLPEGMNLSNVISGMDSNATYGTGQKITLSSHVISDSDTKYKVRGYEWQYNDGSGWKNVSEDAVGSEYSFITGTLQDGYRYRCKASVQVGSTTSGYVYEVYSNVLVQNTKRGEVSFSLQASKADGALDTSISYGVATKDKLKLLAQVAPKNEQTKKLNGTVTAVVSYKGTSDDSDDTAVSTVKKYTAVLKSNGTAKIELPFVKAGVYTIKAEYSGNDYYQEAVSDNEYSYYAYNSDETAGNMFRFDDAEVVLDRDSYPYTGKEICPEVRVSWNGALLEKDTDYTVEYSDNINVGDSAGKVKITPTGKFAGQKEKSLSFSIVKATPVINVPGEQYQVTIGDNTQKINATVDVEGTLKYSSSNSDIATVDENGLITPVKAGTVDITISLAEKEGCYEKAVKTVKLKVNGKNIADARLSFVRRDILKDTKGNPYVYYYGEACKPGVNVSYNGAALVKDTDYTLSYQGNNEVGEASVQVIGKGDYTGVKSLAFEMKKGTATPTPTPTLRPTEKPTATPVVTPTKDPGASATNNPGASATNDPGASATNNPGASATNDPGASATNDPGASATNNPGASATNDPGASATKTPGTKATKKPTTTSTSRPRTTATRRPVATRTPRPVRTSVPYNKNTSQVKVTDINITGISKKIAAGKKVALEAQITPQNAADNGVVWSSSNTKYATVSETGVVKTTKAGAGKSVDITATAKDGSGVSAVYRIKIMKNAVTGIKFSSKKVKVKAGKKQKLRVKIKTNGAKANKKLLWTSSDSKRVKVNSKGVIVTKAGGGRKSVTIKAMATDGSNKKATIVVLLQ